MKRIVNYLFLIFIFSFMFLTNVKAECSYQERKQLLDDAKNVDISYEPIDNGNNSYSFKFYVTGISKNIFIKYYNLNNGIESFIFNEDTDSGLYNFVDNNAYNIYTYDFIIYSSNENCTGHKLYTKKITKPMYNVYSENPNCKFENNKNFKYCEKFFDKDYKLTSDKFNKALLEYNDNLEVIEEVVVKKDYKKYITSGVLTLFFIISIFIVFKIVRDKKNKL